MIDEDLLQSLSDVEVDLIDSSINENNVCGRCTAGEFGLPIVTGLVASFLREG